MNLFTPSTFLAVASINLDETLLPLTFLKISSHSDTWFQTYANLGLYGFPPMQSFLHPLSAHLIHSVFTASSHSYSATISSIGGYVALASKVSTHAKRPFETIHNSWVLQLNLTCLALARTIGGIVPRYSVCKLMSMHNAWSFILGMVSPHAR